MSVVRYGWIESSSICTGPVPSGAADGPSSHDGCGHHCEGRVEAGGERRPHLGLGCAPAGCCGRL